MQRQTRLTSLQTYHAAISAATIAVAAAPLFGDVRAIDGSGNNPDNPLWGAAHTPLLRLTTLDYADGISEPSGPDRPNARVISNQVAAQAGSTPSLLGVSDLCVIWGQFIDHDIDLTAQTGPEDREFWPIAVPEGDPWFDPAGEGDHIIPFRRSRFVEGTGTDESNPREQPNFITSFIDGSVVYGSSPRRAALLRTEAGDGKLHMGDDNYLPYNWMGVEMGNPLGLPEDALFAAGDVRGNENLILLALQTVFAREHNRLCDEIQTANPDFPGEEIYQRARKLIGAQLQWITYNEFLPALIGQNVIAEYDGYDSTVNPSIANVFSTAAYRVGHSMVNEIYLRLDDSGSVIDEGNVSLRHAFFSPQKIYEGGPDALLKGSASQIAQEADNRVTSSIRNFLFGPPGMSETAGLDLAALNLQRGRDHGLPGYNQTRIDFGLAPVRSFADITSDRAMQALLAKTYDNDVNKIDIWVGGLAEDHLRGSNFGELFTTIVADQFTRLRDGDRFWFENDQALALTDIAEITSTTLTDVIARNTSLTSLQENVFYAPSNGVPVFEDINQDGLVNGADLGELLAMWGQVSNDPDLAKSDINGDGIVDGSDLGMLLQAWTG